jgi:polysaccharide export outer membrane protein
VLSIQVLHADEISRLTYQVDEHGECNLPIVGRIRVAGLSAPEVEAELAKKLKAYILDPQVTVRVQEHKSRPISIIGAVKTPGTHYLRGSTTLLSALAAAGGLEKEAAGTVIIKRQKEHGSIPSPGAALDATGNYYVAEVFVRKLMDAESQAEVELQPNDVLLVRRVDVVSILGEVGRPGTVPLSESGTLSVLEALSQSGGLKPTADAAGTRILRPIMGGPRRAELPVNLTSIMKGKEKDMPLLANDILVVPVSGGRVAITRILEMLIGPAVTLGTAATISR